MDYFRREQGVQYINQDAVSWNASGGINAGINPSNFVPQFINNGAPLVTDADRAAVGGLLDSWPSGRIQATESHKRQRPESIWPQQAHLHQPLPPPRRKQPVAEEPLPPAGKTLLMGVLRGVVSQPLSAAFLHPVVKEHPDLAVAYTKAIRRPMDLSTIARRLKRGSYHGAGKFYRDVSRIFKNCLLFNGGNDLFVNTAQHLQWLADSLMAETGLPLAGETREKTRERIESLRMERFESCWMVPLRVPHLNRVAAALGLAFGAAGGVGQAGEGVTVPAVVNNFCHEGITFGDAVLSARSRLNHGPLPPEALSSIPHLVVAVLGRAAVDVAGEAWSIVVNALATVSIPLAEENRRGCEFSCIWARPVSLVWAKQAKNTYWPALKLGRGVEAGGEALTPLNAARLPANIQDVLDKQSKQMREGSVLVEFLGTHEFAWLKDDDIHAAPITDLDRNPNPKPIKKKSFEKSMEEAARYMQIWPPENIPAEPRARSLSEDGFTLDETDVGNGGPATDTAESSEEESEAVLMAKRKMSLGEEGKRVIKKPRRGSLPAAVSKRKGSATMTKKQRAIAVVNDFVKRNKLSFVVDDGPVYPPLSIPTTQYEAVGWDVVGGGFDPLLRQQHHQQQPYEQQAYSQHSYGGGYVQPNVHPMPSAAHMKATSAAHIKATQEAAEITDDDDADIGAIDSETPKTASARKEALRQQMNLLGAELVELEERVYRQEAALGTSAAPRPLPLLYDELPEGSPVHAQQAMLGFPQPQPHHRPTAQRRTDVPLPSQVQVKPVVTAPVDTEVESGGRSRSPPAPRSYVIAQRTSNAIPISVVRDAAHDVVPTLAGVGEEGAQGGIYAPPVPPRPALRERSRDGRGSSEEERVDAYRHHTPIYSITPQGPPLPLYPVYSISHPGPRGVPGGYMMAPHQYYANAHPHPGPAGQWQG